MSGADVDREQARKARSYQTLVAKYGMAAVAAAILVKWLSDRDADQAWERLAGDINAAQPYRVRRPYLTKAEIAMLTLFATGLGTRQVALVLDKSLETIKTQLKAVAHRLETNTTTESVAVGIRSGQVLPPTAIP